MNSKTTASPKLTITYFCRGCGLPIEDKNTDWNQLAQRAADCFVCRDRISRREVIKAKDQWETSFCLDCGQTIRYNHNWDKIPSFCPACAKKRKLSRYR